MAREQDNNPEGFVEKLVNVNRVAKVVKGGRIFEIGRASCRERV